ncbi:MAG: thermonuclease family protein [Nitratireductor sp.]|nr:thermonuclease family protein [Nitratireductor sp.]
MRLLAVILVALSACGAPARAREDVRVVDGDGLRIADVRIRLWGIDAPELDQRCGTHNNIPCGEDARFLLEALTKGGDVVCETRDRDPYGRVVAQCFAGGYDLAGEMVRQGYALDWPRYSSGHYQDQQAEAREAGRGMWAGPFTPPWDWRSQRR